MHYKHQECHSLFSLKTHKENNAEFAKIIT